MPFSSFNFRRNIADPLVDRNFDKARLLLNTAKLHWSHQTHGIEICEITLKTQEPPTCDALITRVPGIALMIRHADCQAALFYDPVEQVIAAVHAGWRGSVQNIYGHLINRLHDHYHCQPANLLVCLSPSLGPSHAEFIHYRTELPESFWDYQVQPNYFDFWAISDWQLRTAGIQPHHIEMARMCTFANATDCFSHRREKPAGNHGTAILIKKFI